MKTRKQIYGREASEILRDISTYHYIRHKQLLRLYPSKKSEVIDNLLSYLERQGRIFYDPDSDMFYDGCEGLPDFEMLAALWVLVDFIDQTSYHSAVDFPVKLIFFSGDETYEVLYVPSGKETLMENALRQYSDEGARRIIIIEDTAQISHMNIPKVAAFCTIADDGKVQYFMKEDAVG